MGQRPLIACPVLALSKRNRPPPRLAQLQRCLARLIAYGSCEAEMSMRARHGGASVVRAVAVYEGKLCSN